MGRAAAQTRREGRYYPREVAKLVPPDAGQEPDSLRRTLDT